MFFWRKTRNSSRAAFLSPFLASPGFGLYFVDPPAPEPIDDNAPTNANGGGGINPPAQRAPAPAGNGNGGGDNSEHHRLGEALRERKKAKSLNRTLLRSLGIDPDTVRQVATNDPANPYRLEGVPDLEQRLSVARAAIAAGGNGNGANGTAGKRGQVSLEVATLTAQNDALRKQVSALVQHIQRAAVVEPIRRACMSQHAIDDDNGAFDDIVSQVAPKFKVDVDLDPEDSTARPDVRVYATDASGNPLIGADNKPATPDSLVSDFLAKRPKYRQANFRAGPGAGGSTVGRRSAGLTTVPDDKSARNGRDDPAMMTAKAMSSYFGGMVKAEDLLD